MPGDKETPQVLIVDDDPAVCGTMVKILDLQGIPAEYVLDQGRVMDRLTTALHRIVLLDIRMPGISGIDLLPEILKASPGTRVIMVTGYGDMETVIEALRRGAFDFLEKPVPAQLLIHSVRRAMRLQNAELKFERSCVELEARKAQLEEINQQLLMSNKALTIMAKNIEHSRLEATKEVVLKVRSIIVPIILRIKEDQRFSAFSAELAGLLDYVEELATRKGVETRLAALLSSSELRIASLIRNGLTSQAIADHLCISPGTVKAHRRNIRKKLGINGEDQSLLEYMKTED